MSLPQTIDQAAFWVGDALFRADPKRPAVLSGGACAAVYAPEVVQSYDLDFIVPFFATEAAKSALADLGFGRRGKDWRHPDMEFSVELPQGPLMIAGDHITEWDVRERNGQSLALLTPSHCVMDRLAWCVCYPDQPDLSALHAAVQVVRAAGRNAIDWPAVRDWAERSGESRFVDDLLARA